MENSYQPSKPLPNDPPPKISRIKRILSKMNLGGVVFFFLALVGIAAALIMVKSSQDLRQQAAGEIYNVCAGGVEHGNTACGGTAPDSCFRCNDGRFEPAPGECTSGPCAPQNQITDFSCAGGVPHGEQACGGTTPDSCVKCENGRFVPDPNNCDAGPCAIKNQVTDNSCAGGVSHGSTTCGGVTPESCFRCENGRLVAAPGQCKTGPCKSDDPAPTPTPTTSPYATPTPTVTANVSPAPALTETQALGGTNYGTSLKCAQACSGHCVGENNNICVSFTDEEYEAFQLVAKQTIAARDEYREIENLFYGYLDGENNADDIMDRCAEYLGQNDDRCDGEQSAVAAVFGISDDDLSEVTSVRENRIVERLLDTSDEEWDTSELNLSLAERATLGTFTALQSVFGDSSSGYVNTMMDLNASGENNLLNYERWRASVELGGKIGAAIAVASVLPVGGGIVAGGAGLTGFAGAATTGLAAANLSYSSSQTAIVCQTVDDWQNNEDCARAQWGTALAAANTVVAPIAATSAIFNAGGTASGLTSTGTTLGTVAQSANTVRTLGVTLGAGNTIMATNIAQDVCDENPQSSSCTWAWANVAFAGANTAFTAATPLINSSSLNRATDLALAIAGGGLDAQVALNDCVASGGDALSCSIAVGQFIAGTTQDYSQIRNTRAAEANLASLEAANSVRVLMPGVDDIDLNPNARVLIPGQEVDVDPNARILIPGETAPLDPNTRVLIAGQEINADPNARILLPEGSENIRSSQSETTAEVTRPNDGDLIGNQIAAASRITAADVLRASLESARTDTSADPETIRDSDLIGDQIADASRITAPDVIRAVAEDIETGANRSPDPLGDQIGDASRVTAGDLIRVGFEEARNRVVDVVGELRGETETASEITRSNDGDLIGDQVAAASRIEPGDVVRVVADEISNRVRKAVAPSTTNQTVAEANNIQRDPTDGSIIGDQIGRAVDAPASVWVRVFGEDVVQNFRQATRSNADSDLPEQLRSPRKPVAEALIDSIRTKGNQIITDLQIAKPWTRAIDAIANLGQVRANIQNSLATRTSSLIDAVRNGVQDLRSRTAPDQSNLTQVVGEDLLNTTIIVNRSLQGSDQELILSRSLFSGVENESFISKRHAALFADSSGNLRITDYSTNGTYINNKRIPYGASVIVRPGDSVQLGAIDRGGQVEFVSSFRVDDRGGLFQLRDLSSNRLIGVVAKPEHIIAQLPNIRATVGDDLEIASGFIGRINNELLSDPTISRRQAEIITNAYGVSAIKDGTSSNGTFVNGQRLGSGELRPLREGDVVVVGRTTLEVGYDLNTGRLALLDSDGNIIRVQIEEGFEPPDPDFAIPIRRTRNENQVLEYRELARTSAVLDEYRGRNTVAEELVRQQNYQKRTNLIWLYSPSGRQENSGINVRLDNGQDVELTYKVHVSASAQDFDPILREMTAYLRDIDILHKISPGLHYALPESGRQYGKTMTIYASSPETLRLIAAKARELGQNYQGIPISELRSRGSNLQHELEVPGTNGILYYTVERVNGHYLGPNGGYIDLGGDSYINGYAGRRYIMSKSWGQGPLDHLWQTNSR
jgi:pSer/pThr/pTyr-binding forkhead associated (FHA) protein